MNMTKLSDEKIIAEALRECSRKYDIEQVDSTRHADLLDDISSLYSLRDKRKLVLFDAFDIGIDQENAQLVAVTITTNIPSGGLSGVKHEDRIEIEFIGVSYLNNDYGNVFIRPETFADKINDFFNPTEVNFDMNPDFSAKYYVLTEDESKLRKAVTYDFLSAIGKHDDLYIQINGNRLMTRPGKKVSVDSSLALCQFMNDINNDRI